jgi:caspase domain-containing protein
MTKYLARTIAAIGAALWLALVPGVALADKRVALVVGNSNYQAVNPLPNPSRDATSIAKMLKDAGFESVDTLIDVGNLDFKRGIRKFEDTASDADIAVIYYAGHGIEIGGTNYLIPIDAKLASDRDAQDEAITLDRLVSSADSAKKLRVIILDACRDNPFAGRMRRDSVAARRGISSGLTRVDPSSTDTLIAYAAKAGSTAEDGDGDHSPFTTALLKDLTVPGRDVRIAFGYVKDDVMKATSGRQEPFVYGSLGGGTYSLVQPPAQAQAPSLSDAKSDYDLVAKINTTKAWEVYLNTYKTGFYADLARVQLASLEQPPEPTVRQATTKEQQDWDRIKDTSDPSVLQTYIKRYPDSPLAITAQDRINTLIKAAQDRADQARLAQEETDRKAAEAAAAKQRELDEQKAKQAQADQKAKADAATKQAIDAKAKADKAAQLLAAAEAAKLREESERAAKAAADEQQKAQAAAAAEAVCKQQGDQLAALQAKGSTGTGVDDMTAFVKTVTCDRIKPQALAALNTFTIEAAKRTADLVRTAQTELTRIGCYTGNVDGVMSDPTKSALSRYLSAKGLPSNDLTISDTLVTSLQKQQPITCLRSCPSGQTLSGDTCVAAAKPAPAPAPKPVATPAPKPVPQAKNTDSGRKPQRQQAESRPAPQPAPQPAPHAAQQASTGGGGGHIAPMVGVGF